MRRAPLVLLALLGWSAPARAQWEVSGHFRYQFSVQHFDREDLGARMVARNPLDQRVDGRLNVTRRHRRLDVTGSGELLVLWGDAVAASRRVPGDSTADFLFGLPDRHDTHQWVNLGGRATLGDRAECFTHLDRLAVCRIYGRPLRGPGWAAGA